MIKKVKTFGNIKILMRCRLQNGKASAMVVREVVW